MRCKKLNLIAVFFLVMGLSSLSAQEAIPVSGGNASGTGGTVSFSVGQVAYTVVDGTEYSISQGVQQPYNITVVTGVGNASLISLSCSVYPNPATDYLILRVDGYTPSKDKLEYRLFNVSGSLLSQGKVDDSEVRVQVANLSPATYFLKVMEQGQDVKTFKIIKK